MLPFTPSAVLLADFYKVGHIQQYPTDTTQVWSNWTPRTSRVPGQRDVIHFGLQYFIKEFLQNRFQRDFFNQPLRYVIRDYKAVIENCLGIANPRTDHIEQLWDLGYLPITIYSILEGHSTPLGCPSLVITNTHPDFFWLPNYFETMLSMALWKPSTSATTARRFREICHKWGVAAGERDTTYLNYQCHDFSMRGMSGLEDACISGMGHLTSFTGTDTIPAILAAEHYYGAALTAGASVAATEHSVMCAGEKDNELETFRRLIEDVYPTGIVSIVSDTWDLWKVLTEYVPALRNKILARDGKLVIRPDSGDPVKILCGDPEASNPHVRAGVLRLLADKLGTVLNPTGTLPLIDHAAAIYGDSISPERADEILRRCVTELGLSPANVVFGVGSYTYELVTRDTHGFAMKATAVTRAGRLVEIFKDPVTDDGGKRSHRGIPAVYRTEDSTDDCPEYFCVQGASPADLDNCAFERVYHNGGLLVEATFDTIRQRVRSREKEGLQL